MTDTTLTHPSQVQPGLVVDDASAQIQKSNYAPVIPFIVKPYLMLGDNEAPCQFPQLALAWHTAKMSGDWKVEFKVEGASASTDTGPVETIRLKVKNVETHQRHTAHFSGLENDKRFQYRVSWQGKTVFQASARAPKSADKPYRVAVVGDVADGGTASKTVVNRLFLSDPDLTILAGDIVYKRGKFTEYLANYFPVFNAEIANPEIGAPFIRSYLMTAVVGNHDVTVPPEARKASSDENAKGKKKEKKKKGKSTKRSELFAFEVFFRHPENGPTKPTRDLFKLDGEYGKFEQLFDEFGPALIGRTNFSLSYGNSFWLHLDGNEYMDWTQPKLRKWVSDQLASASQYTWKFVVIHQPPFTSDIKYWSEQSSRLLCGLFEAHGVDIVFSGHCHVYERTHPLSFAMATQPNGKFVNDAGMVDGRMTLDKQFDGKAQRKPNGVIYITTGAGGKELGSDHYPDPKNSPPFTCKIDTDHFSVSVLDIDGKRLKFEQVSADSGEVIDQLFLEK